MSDNKKEVILFITCGLPGSGKSHWANKKSKENETSMYGRYGTKNPIITIDFDQISRGRAKQKDLLQNLVHYLRNKNSIIVDGLFLTYDDVSKLLKEVKSGCGGIINPIDKVYIEWWQPMVEYCLYNDQYRRTESSEITIKNAQMDPMNMEFIKKLEEEFPELKGKIEYHLHSVEKKPKWKLFGQMHGIPMTEEGIVTGSHWCLGGSWQNCWGSGGSVAGEPEPEDFTTFDELLERVSPNISFLQYKNISSRVIRTETYGESDYYGGSTTSAYKYFNMNDLYELLVEKNIIEEL